MAIKEIIKIPDPVLRENCAAIEDITPELKTLMEDMLETMYDAPGVGLAAPHLVNERRQELCARASERVSQCDRAPAHVDLGGVQPERCCDLFLYDAAGLLHLHRHAAIEQRHWIQPAQHDVGVGQGWIGAPLTVGHRSRVRVPFLFVCRWCGAERGQP